MNDTQVKSRVKLAVKRALVGATTGQDIKSIIEFQHRDLIRMNGEALNNMELSLLTEYSIQFN
jgi:hypothetical protein